MVIESQEIKRNYSTCTCTCTYHKNVFDLKFVVFNTILLEILAGELILADWHLQ